MHAVIDKQIQISPVFGNSEERAEARYRALSALYDAQTVRHLEQRGVDQGWSCLEVGGGGGSITSWLCDRVGNTGRVMVTDVDTNFLHTLSCPNLEVRRHDIQTEGLPKHQFHLAHARLVLTHLPERELALRRMLKTLTPGGWIVIEEFDDLLISPDSSVNSAEVELQVRRAFRHVLASRGHYGRLLPQQLRRLGLVNLGAEASVSIWRGNSAGANLLKLTCQELRDPIIGSGLISQSEFDAEMKRMDEHDFLMSSPMMWTVWGQVPFLGLGGLSTM